MSPIIRSRFLIGCRAIGMAASDGARHSDGASAVGLLMLIFALALTSAVQKSPTMDEQNHIARGAAYLGTGDPRLSVEHPPLVNVLSALPAYLLLDLHLPLDEWWEFGEWYVFADNFLWQANAQPDRIVFLARLPIIGLGLVLASLVFRWAGRRWGPWGGLLAAAFCGLDPNILAHTRLSTTDLGGTCFVFLAAYALWRAVRRPSWPRVLGSGLAFGLALSAKLSNLLFGPIFALVILADALSGRCGWKTSGGSPQASLKQLGTGSNCRSGESESPTVRPTDSDPRSPRSCWSVRQRPEQVRDSDTSSMVRNLTVWAFTVLLGLLVVWAAYGFQVGRLAENGPLLPATPYLEGILAILNFSAGGRPAYLLGQYADGGWWYYFLVAFAVKTPLATLAALLWATGTAIRRFHRDDLWLLIPPIAYFLLSMTSSLNIGYRHLLPILPFLAVHIARLASSLSSSPCLLVPGCLSSALSPCPLVPLSPCLSTARRFLPLILAIWLFLGTFLIYPHFLAYFNPLGGGPQNGWRTLVDSNIDWGQDLKGLKAWMEQEGVDRVRLGWFGSARAEAYGIDYDLLPGVPHGFALWEDPPFNREEPEPGVYAISVTNLVGVHFPDHDFYAWFRDRPPDAKIGYSLFIYEVPADD